MQPNRQYIRIRQCRHGTLMYNIHDQYLGRSLDLYGEFSEGEIEFFRAVLRPRDIVVDAGANIGAHAIFMAQVVADGGAVFAFEPQRILFQMLCGNVAINNLVNVYCHPMALGEAPGQVAVPQLDPRIENNFGALGLGAWKAGDMVEVRTLDSFKLPRCRLIKVDVEGMEMNVLKGAADTISRHRPFLYVENDRAENSADLVRYIDSLGYAMHWHTPYLFNPNNFLKNPQNVFGNYWSGNMICIPREMPSQIINPSPVEGPPPEDTTRIPSPPGNFPPAGSDAQTNSPQPGQPGR